jgi:hypothetical protein
MTTFPIEALVLKTREKARRFCRVMLSGKPCL